MLKTRLKESRARFGLKQEDLANLVGVRRETIGNLKNGRYNPSLKLAMDISKVFRITVEKLFCFEGGVKQRGAGGTYLRRARAGYLSPGEGLGDGGWILHPPLRVLRRRTDTDLS